MENICRTCLRASQKLIPLNEKPDVVNQIEVIASIKLNLTDSYPKNVCEECSSNINKFYNFRKVIRHSHRDLKERVAALALTLHKPAIKRSFKRECKNQTKTNISSSSTNNNSHIIAPPCDVNVNIKDEAEILEKKEISKNDIDFLKIEEETINKKEYEVPSNEDNDTADNIEYNDTESEDRDVQSENDNSNPDNKISQDPNESKEIQRMIALLKAFKCQLCNQMFSSRRKLNNHRRTEHYPKQICNICGVICRADNIKRHVAMHSEGPVPCATCGKVCKNSESLRGHMLIHKGEIYTCEICGRTTRLKAEHKRHLKGHQDPELGKYMCNVCGKKVRDLKRHILTHTGERPYTCEYCSKGFTSPYALKVHTRLHTNERPYMCDYCSLAFPQKVSLVLHIKSKHQEQM